MLKEEIRNEILSRNSNPNQTSSELLTGQTIKESELINLSVYKLMNDAEREIVSSILDSMRMKNEGINKGVALSKRMDSLVPRSEEVGFKEAA